MAKKAVTQFQGQLDFFASPEIFAVINEEVKLPPMPKEQNKVSKPTTEKPQPQVVAELPEQNESEAKSEVKIEVVSKKGNPIDFAPKPGTHTFTNFEQRLEANIEAIKVMERLLVANEYATADQQQTLAMYSGWEGIVGHKEHEEKAKKRLDAEFTEARTQELFMLPKYPFAPAKRTLDSLYKAVTHVGFKSGSVLLTGTGAGGLIQGMPNDMRKKSRLTVDATDGIVGEITSALYPKLDVKGQADELPDNFYDIALSVLPYDTETTSITLKKHSISMERYACQIARVLFALRSGGIFFMLVESKMVNKLGRITNPFSLSPTPINLLGGLRLDENAMQNGESYDLLVFEKCKDKRDVRESNILESTSRDILTATGNKKIYFSENSYIAGNEFYLGNKPSARDGHVVITEFEEERDYRKALKNILDLWNCRNKYTPVEIDTATEEFSSIPADPAVKNYSMVLINDCVYQRIDSLMVKQKLEGARLERVKRLIEIRDHAKQLVELQLKNCSDEELVEAQESLSVLYDNFVKNYGHLTNQTNTRLFREDADYSILAALETRNEEDEIVKSDVFTMRTIVMRNTVTECATIDDAYFVCMDQKARVDISHIAALSGQSEQDVITCLEGRVIFRNPCNNPDEDAWVPHDVYLSGNTRKKLAEAEQAVLDGNDKMIANVEALKKAVPPLIPARDIYIKIGAPYISPSIIQDFIYEVIGKKRVGSKGADFPVARNVHSKWTVRSRAYIPITDPNFFVKHKDDVESVLWIIERLLNTMQVVVYKSVKDPDTGKIKRVKNHEATMVLLEKAEEIQNEFSRWVFANPEREAAIVKEYNETFNTNTIPVFDGSHLTFPGMTSTITLQPHQKNAVYRIIVQNGILASHVVGGGKTITLLAAGQELKRLGRVSKPMYVVPNNLLAQWGGEMSRLYPAANILVADPDDMRKARRKRFLSRIATGFYDAVIIGSSSFIQLPPPAWIVQDTIGKKNEKLAATIGMRDIPDAVAKRNNEERLTFFKRCHQAPYTIEDLGIDYLFVDESHEYKNLYAQSAQGDVRGLSNSGAAKSTDMYYKTKYMRHLHGGKGGFTFATGTALVNSIIEMYSLMRYFTEEELMERGIFTLDNWLSIFAQITTDWELPPEGLAENGAGFRRVTRVSSFKNVPELMALVLQFMDTVTRDEITMQTPDVIRITESCKPSSFQKDYMGVLVERANDVRKGVKKPEQDNMLLITVDGRKVALDARIIDTGLYDHIDSKVNKCARNVIKNYREYNALKGTQIVFCDISTPNQKGFNVYTALKETLVDMGIPEDEIAFAHEFKTTAARNSMRIRMQTGKLRVLIGSTQTVGQGMNIQNRLVALHHLDTPWVPKDLEQREGRGIRPGNMNAQILVYYYVTEGSFDAFMFQLVELKAKLISQVLRGDYTKRSIEDNDTKVLSYAEVKAIATGNSDLLELAKIDGELVRLQTLKKNHEIAQETLKQNVYVNLPKTIASLEALIPNIEKDIATISNANGNVITVAGTTYPLTQEGESLARKAISGILVGANPGDIIGTYCGLSIVLAATHSWTLYRSELAVTLKGAADHRMDNSFAGSGYSVLSSCRSIIRNIPESLVNRKAALKANEQALSVSKTMVGEAFEHESRIEFLLSEKERLTKEVAKIA